jgi:uncharacterized protein YeaO (DUF488 family)
MGIYERGNVNENDSCIGRFPFLRGTLTWKGEGKEPMTIHIKRVYEMPETNDGKRILVDRLWPRGFSKEKAKIDHWLKEIAPSTELRHWYSHEPEKWAKFKERYFKELDGNPESVKELLGYVRKGTATLLYSSKEERLNNAVALKEYVESMLKKS